MPYRHQRTKGEEMYLKVLKDEQKPKPKAGLINLQRTSIALKEQGIHDSRETRVTPLGPVKRKTSLGPAADVGPKEKRPRESTSDGRDNSCGSSLCSDKENLQVEGTRGLATNACDGGSTFLQDRSRTHWPTSILDARGLPCGLHNTGNTCYIAAALQAVLLSPGFDELLCKLRHKWPIDCVPHNGVIGTMLEMRQAYGSPGRDGATNVEVVRRLVRRRFPSLRRPGHHDVFEFLHYLFEELQKEVLTIESAEHGNGQVPFSATQCPATRVFSFGMTKEVTCTQCVRKWEYKDQQWALEFAMTSQGSSDLGRELHQLFHTKGEQMHHCEECNSSQNCTVGQKFHRLPNVLVVHANRNQCSKKCSTGMRVPQELKIEDGRIVAEPSQRRFTYSFDNRDSSIEKGSINVWSEAPRTQDEEESMVKRALAESLGESTAQDGQDGTNWKSTAPGSAREEEAQLEQALRISEQEFEKSSQHDSPREVASQCDLPPLEVFEGKGSLKEDDDSGSVANGEYKLCAYITHKGGSVLCGHYTAHVTGSMDYMWYLCNDSVVRRVTKCEAQDDAVGASVFFYKAVKSKTITTFGSA